MKYRIVCQGRLLAGAKEKECVQRIQRITKLSEENIRTTLLNGKPRKIFASDDKSRTEKYGLAFRNAGLDILIQHEEAMFSSMMQAAYR
ncbi:MAG: hypothetical protein D3916_07685 [Candidatus Electrothrix sp. MAN1_4]|nr:hypothetical protein [Candidatus Electrothrix sp. MAN1_4]